MARVRDQFAPKGVPAEDWDAIRELTIELASKVSAPNATAARRLMTVLGRYLHWCHSRAHYRLEPGFVLRRDVIGTYITHLKRTTTLTVSTLGTYRSRLFAVADANIGHLQPSHRSPSLRRSDASTPYNQREIVALKSWANHQPSQQVRVELHILLALTLGAGLASGEVITARVRDVSIDDDGVLIHVPGRRPRLVPVLAEWEQPLIDYVAAAWSTDMLLFQPQRTSMDKNVVYNLIHRSKSKPFQINAQRLRATWIVTHLQAGVPVQALLDASGMTSLDGLGRFLHFLPNTDPARSRHAFVSRARAEGCTAPCKDGALKSAAQQ